MKCFCSYKTSGGDDKGSDDDASDDSLEDDIMATASMLMCAHVRRGLLRETADFVAKFKDGFEAGLVAADLLKKLRKRREDL